MIKDIKSFIKTSLIAETSTKKYAANYALQLRNDLLIIKFKMLQLRNRNNKLILRENTAIIRIHSRLNIYIFILIMFYTTVVSNISIKYDLFYLFHAFKNI